MTSLLAAAREYICPGDRHSIPRAVHLARMEAGFAKCRECPLSDGRGFHQSSDRTAVPHLSGNPFRRLFRTDGVRGVYRSELDAAAAGRLAAGLAAMLWEDVAGVAPANGFLVVVGCDDRPWSLPLATAVGGALRRAGCESIDIGLATGAAFRFAVAHLDAAGGVLATGAGGGPAVAGLDFALGGGRPLSLGGGLDRLADLAEQPPVRMTRRGGGRREFDISVPYETGLRRHLSSVAALTGVVGSPSPLLLARLERITVDLPAKVHLVRLPRRPHDGDGTDPVGIARLAAAVRDRKADLGLWIDEDGGAARAIDETGSPVSVADFAELLLNDALTQQPASPIVLDWPLAERLRGTALRGESVRGNGTAEAMAVSVRDHVPAAGADSSGRFWVPGPPPTCNALLMLARLLRILGDGGTPFSHRVRVSNSA